MKAEAGAGLEGTPLPLR